MINCCLNLFDFLEFLKFLYLEYFCLKYKINLKCSRSFRFRRSEKDLNLRLNLELQHFRGLKLNFYNLQKEIYSGHKNLLNLL